MSALGDTIGKYIPIMGRKPKMDRGQVLSVVPVRNPVVVWERGEAEVLLTIPMRNDKLAKVIKKIVRGLPENRKIQLDEIGSLVWELCDGNRNIEDIVRAVAEQTKLTRREAEASATMFLHTLAKKNLIGLMSGGGKKRSVKTKKR